MKQSPTSTAEIDALKARGSFNDFMNRSLNSGALEIQHVRVLCRQPTTEAFARKTAFSVKNFASKTNVNISITELQSHVVNGPTAVGEAAALIMKSVHPSLARYMGSPSSASSVGAELQDMSDTDLFTLLRLYTAYEVSRRLLLSPSYSSGVISVAGSLGHATDHVSDQIKVTADSVYAQSLADVHAISLRAAFDGNKLALTTLNEVMVAREASGDFGKYSTAPLSHDTRLSLNILQSQLSSGHNFSAMSRDDLWENSCWTAGEGTAAWMQCNGVEYRDASNLIVGIETVNDVVSMASNVHIPSAFARPTMRPVA